MKTILRTLTFFLIISLSSCLTQREAPELHGEVCVVDKITPAPEEGNMARVKITWLVGANRTEMVEFLPSSHGYYPGLVSTVRLLIR